MEQKRTTKNIEQEQVVDKHIPTAKSIDELLPRYYEKHENGVRYETIRSMPIDGHEVAWMEFKGGRIDGSEYSGRTLHCACEFEENVGWKVDKKYGAVKLDGERKCLPRKIAEILRHLELRQEYQDKFKDTAKYHDVYDLWEKIPEITADLIEKDKSGEFIGEGSSGAHFWGGHFYLQTIKEITDIDYDKLWPIVHEMIAKKQIQLEGMVVQEYYEPPKPSWSEYGKFEIDQYTVTAHLPDHSKMPQNWQYSVYDKVNEKFVAEQNFSGSNLMHSPDFGVDVSDIAQAEQDIDDIVKFIKEKYEKGEEITPELLYEFTNVLFNKDELGEGADDTNETN